jgi:hypothetical protein
MSKKIYNLILYVFHLVENSFYPFLICVSIFFFFSSFVLYLYLKYHLFQVVIPNVPINSDLIIEEYVKQKLTPVKETIVYVPVLNEPEPEPVPVPVLNEPTWNYGDLLTPKNIAIAVAVVASTYLLLDYFPDSSLVPESVVKPLSPAEQIRMNNIIKSRLMQLYYKDYYDVENFWFFR